MGNKYHEVAKNNHKVPLAASYLPLITTVTIVLKQKED